MLSIAEAKSLRWPSPSDSWLGFNLRYFTTVCTPYCPNNSWKMTAMPVKRFDNEYNK